MDIQARFDHFNFNVFDLERSLKFYEEALGLKEHHRKEEAVARHFASFRIDTRLDTLYISLIITIFNM